jgi:hypothetical protein
VEIGDWRPLFPTRVGEEIGDIGAARLNAYVKELEQPLLSASKEFYAREASSWIGSDSCPEYLKKVNAVTFSSDMFLLFRQTRPQVDYRVHRNVGP